MKVQSVVFDRNHWTLSKAKKWIVANNYKLKHRNKTADIKETQFRFRQSDPGLYKKFVSKKLNNGVILIFGI